MKLKKLKKKKWKKGQKNLQNIHQVKFFQFENNNKAKIYTKNKNIHRTSSFPSLKNIQIKLKTLLNT